MVEGAQVPLFKKVILLSPVYVCMYVLRSSCKPAVLSAIGTDMGEASVYTGSIAT